SALLSMASLEVTYMVVLALITAVLVVGGGVFTAAWVRARQRRLAREAAERRAHEAAVPAPLGCGALSAARARSGTPPPCRRPWESGPAGCRADSHPRRAPRRALRGCSPRCRRRPARRRPRRRAPRRTGCAARRGRRGCRWRPAPRPPPPARPGS